MGTYSHAPEPARISCFISIEREEDGSPVDCMIFDRESFDAAVAFSRASERRVLRQIEADVTWSEPVNVPSALKSEPEAVTVTVAQIEALLATIGDGINGDPCTKGLVLVDLREALRQIVAGDK